jgi:hypothetical protein
MDNDKVLTVVNWPLPRNFHVVHGFLGLAGYYRKFIRGFSTIVATLSDSQERWVSVDDEG